MPGRRIDRRAFLAACAGVAGTSVLSACSSGSSPGLRDSPPPGATPESSAAPRSSGAASAEASVAAPATRVPLPATRPWQPGAGETNEAVKLRAARTVEALYAWPDGGSGETAARTRLLALGVDPTLAGQAGRLLTTDSTAAVQVLVTQLADIVPSAASVVVVLRQWRVAANGQLLSDGTTIEVRLALTSRGWTPTSIHPAVPAPPAAMLPPAVTALLINPRLRLPAAARGDLLSGLVSPGVVAAMTALARTHVLDVSVVRSGTPLLVLATSRRSDHSWGRAFDVWAIDGRPVLDPATRPLLDAVIREALALGAVSVGGPVDLDGARKRSFTDAAHRDHVHLGFIG